MGGKDGQWSPDLTRIPQPPDSFGTHTTPPTPPKNGAYENYSIPRILEMVCQATIR
jgi:hypothetical protein